MEYTVARVISHYSFPETTCWFRREDTLGELINSRFRSLLLAGDGEVAELFDVFSRPRQKHSMHSGWAG